ncbi:MAG: glycoside hydrolase family 172 protein [Chloroflexota bacterium]|jgi:hypothetical protein
MPHLNYRDLISRLTDVQRLATPPLPDERGGTFSSYDRRSRYDAATNQYLDWDANNDGTGFIREEDGAIVVFESNGPGVIWRVWSAFADMGHIQIFIDHASDPVVDLPFRDFFERHPANLNPLGILNLPQLTPTLSRGRNRFIPIPFNTHCKVRFQPGWGLYYHFTYTLFGRNTTVDSYTGQLASAEWIMLAQADRLLALRGHQIPRHPDSIVTHHHVTIPEGLTVEAVMLNGMRAIDGIHVQFDSALDNNEQMLRQLFINIYWDGETQASVTAPLTHFFGSHGLHYHRTMPLGMTTGYGYSHWFMPFGRMARITLTNQGAVETTVRLIISHRPINDADTLLRFRALWHTDRWHAHLEGTGREIDWPLLLTSGQGRFCGMHLHVTNQWHEPNVAPTSWWNGVWDQKNIDWWWGEGDEKFFVDGERFPSTFGTGSEDYIGYAWAAEPPFPVFESAYASQPYLPIHANGETSINRVHICDDVPFQHSFAGYIEKYKPNTWDSNNRCTYAVVVFWYSSSN